MSYLITRLNDKIHYIVTFSSDVVHEFKNPLAAIRSSVDIMNDSSLSEKEKLALYNSINDEIHHLEILLNDIRGISKVEITMRRERFICLCSSVGRAGD